MGNDTHHVILQIFLYTASEILNFILCKNKIFV